MFLIVLVTRVEWTMPNDRIRSRFAYRSSLSWTITYEQHDPIKKGDILKSDKAEGKKKLTWSKVGLLIREDHPPQPKLESPLKKTSNERTLHHISGSNAPTWSALCLTMPHCAQDDPNTLTHKTLHSQTPFNMPDQALSFLKVTQHYEPYLSKISNAC